MARSKTSKVWMHQHVNDPFVHKAVAEGWRSRAVFKLIEIDEKDHLLRQGQTVVDLGSTPGGWSQVAARKVLVKGAGRVLALDLLDMAPIPGVEFLQGDFTEDETLARLEQALAGRRVDLVISDMAPNLTGVAATDQSRGVYLLELALDFARTWLKPDGALLVKAFHGGGFDDFRKAMQSTFQQFQVRKPDASRDRSSEVYLLGRKLRADLPAR
jgi:23S rRNA (uridine2552-2'-O)-methyltransferase